MQKKRNISLIQNLKRNFEVNSASLLKYVKYFSAEYFASLQILDINATK